MDHFFSVTWPSVVKGLAAVSGFVLGLFGEWDALLSVLLGCMVVDYLLGLIVAAMGKSTKTESGGLSSNVGFTGLLRKCVVLLMVMLGAQLDRVIGTDGSAFRTMVCLFYIANEGLSILENTALAGFPFPESLKRVLEQMKAGNDGDDT